MYELPLFFVCVHTNVGYKAVAEFICQSEKQSLISEALNIIKGWNRGWCPKYFVVDYDTKEIGAIGEQFPLSIVYLCHFHRIQALQRWCKARSHGLSSQEQDKFIAYM